MNYSERVKNKFTKCRGENRPAFIAYIAAGDPTYQQSLKVVDTLVEAGVDILEIGVPFADPLADGPTNQEAAQRALDSGMTYLKTFEFCAEIRAKYPELPLVLYTYLNPLAHTSDFATNCAKAKASGADAFLVLDLPPGEGQEYSEVMAKEGIGRVTLVAPTTLATRLPLIARESTEFIYYVAQVGVTGTRANIASDIAEHIAAIRQHADTPVVVGFGISQPEHVEKIKAIEGVEGIVVGSAIVKRIAAIAEGKGTFEELGQFVSSLTAVL